MLTHKSYGQVPRRHAIAASRLAIVLQRSCNSKRPVNGSRNFGDDWPEQLAHLAGDGAELRVLDRDHRRDRIYRRNLDLSAVLLLNQDVARKHRSDLVLKCERLMGELRVACAQNEIRPEVDADLLIQGVLHVDLGQHPKAMVLQSRDRRRDRGFERQVDYF